MGVPDAISAFTRVFDALWQHERASQTELIFALYASAREWCTAEPGPRQAVSLVVPGPQRTAAVDLCPIRAALRSGHMLWHRRL